MKFRKIRLLQKSIDFKNGTIIITIFDNYYNKKTYIKFSKIFDFGWDFTIKFLGIDLISICYLTEMKNNGI